MIDAETGWYVVPATVKAVVVSPERHVLLARNHRRQWELPGGWPSADDRSADDVLRREVFEESGLHVTPGRLLHAELAVVDGSQVMIVAYLCTTNGEAVSTSSEHTDLLWAPHDALPPLELRAYDVAIARGLANTQ
jgi:8-oxo-dGTP pyrophosphatase MutT (NUDIX family)